jgi:N-acetyl-anhydromuramyl-L-alanine amidase AmpD
MKYRNVSLETRAEMGGVRRVPRIGIVLHTTMGTNSLDWLQRGSYLAGKTASADYLIDRAGNIFQLTAVGKFAWHAGKSRWRTYQESDATISRGFVGIEFEAKEQDGEKMTNLQYISGAWLVRHLMMQHSIPITNVVGHYMVALPVGRKSDPMHIDWAVFTREMLVPSIEATMLDLPRMLP